MTVNLYYQILKFFKNFLKYMYISLYLPILNTTLLQVIDRK